MAREKIGPPVVIRMPVTMREDADTLAESLGISLAELVRRALAEYLANAI